MQSTKFGFSGKIKAVDGRGRELADILLEASQNLAGVKGCHLYLISMDSEEPDTISVYEVWDSKQDHDDSLKLEATQQLIGRARPLIDGKPEGKSFEVLGGLGLK